MALLQKICFKYLSKSKLIEKHELRNLYRTVHGDFFWLDPNKYLDKNIIKKGCFERKSTELLKNLIKKGDIVIDVGANIGYYSVIFSRLVGEDGKVMIFEPTYHYREVLETNLEANDINNAEIYDYGLSNKEDEIEIAIGDCSATLHWVADLPATKQEKIKLKTFDSFISEHNIKKVDFIKIDIDGHEPLFLEGGWDSLEKLKPIILLEVNHENYIEAGYTAWDFFTLLKRKKYYIYTEDLEEIATKRMFLRVCGNFTHSANIIISLKQLEI